MPVQAWDGIELRTLTKKSPLRATAAHISIVSHATQDDLLAELDNTLISNGFANRFLYITARRSKLLPFGGDIEQAVIDDLRARIKSALRIHQQPRRLQFDPAAAELWQEKYPILTADRPGLYGSITARAEPQVLRLALVYAALDEVPAIGLAHLQAALEVWRYADAAALAIFGDKIGDRIADTILAALKEAGAEGRSRTELIRMISHSTPISRIDLAFEKLLKYKLAKFRAVATKGKPAEVWSVNDP